MLVIDSQNAISRIERAVFCAKYQSGCRHKEDIVLCDEPRLLVPSACRAIPFPCDLFKLGLFVPTLLYRLEIWLNAKDLVAVLVDSGVITDRGPTSIRQDKVRILAFVTAVFT